MHTLRWTAALAIAASVFVAAPAHAALKFCFGPTSISNPVFDGDIEKDNGWLNSYLYRGGNGAPDANVILQGNGFTDGAGHKWLALGVTVLNDTQWDAGDAVVVLYQSGANSYGQIAISPLQNDVAPTSAAANARPGASSFSTSTTGAPGSWTPVGNAPTWVTWGSVGTASSGQCTAAAPGTACKWTVEMGIDLTAAGITSLQKLYVDVVKVFQRTPVASHQFSWPPGFTLVDATDFTITPAVADWGDASTSQSACSGVNFGYADISASPAGNLKVGVNSTFTVKLHNNGADAKGVVAHFSHAPFGICGLVDSCFVDFGSSNTPTSCPGVGPPCCVGAAACIPPDPTNAGTALQTSWTPVAADEGHQCIRVKLEATQPATSFVNMGTFHNMWVDQASNLTLPARIDMRKVPSPDGGFDQRVRLYSQRTTQYAYADGSIPTLAVGTFTSQIVVQYYGYRYTGKHVTVNRVRSEVWDPVGSYAYAIQHAVPADLQSEFEQRHAPLFTGICRAREMGIADCLPKLKALMPRDPELVRQINGLLEKDQETPRVTDWTFEPQGVKRVGTNADQVELPVPFDSAVTLLTNISYVGGTKGRCAWFCTCFQTKHTATAGLFMGVLLAGVGVFAYRRPR